MLWYKITIRIMLRWCLGKFATWLLLSSRMEPHKPRPLYKLQRRSVPGRHGGNLRLRLDSLAFWVGKKSDFEAETKYPDEGELSNLNRNLFSHFNQNNFRNFKWANWRCQGKHDAQSIKGRGVQKLHRRLHRTLEHYGRSPRMGMWGSVDASQWVSDMQSMSPWVNTF